MTPGLAAPEAFAAALGAIEAVQRPNGFIPWFEGGHGDPWNHVEAAMALSAGGRTAAAERAYRWLAAAQEVSGAWFNYYGSDGDVTDRRLDSNVCAYVATGVWHHYLAAGDAGFVAEMWPVVERAITFVLSLQRPSGELVWSIAPDGTREGYALLTGSSSAYLSLRCAVACAELIGEERPGWELAAGRLRHAVAFRPERFAPKDRYAMDWYYPVLSGALPVGEGTERLEGGWRRFVMEGYGVRCVSDQRWVTTAETAECALACLSVGKREAAGELLSWVQDQRDDDGCYTTGRVYPERSTFPYEERTTYSAAAVVLALDALSEASPSAAVFVHSALPPGLDLDEDERGDLSRRGRV